MVTGTLLDGSLRLGEDVEILPRRKRSRICGLQTHNRKVEQAPPGGRTAVNLAGLTLEDVQRGDVVAHPGQLKPTRALDVKVRITRMRCAAWRITTRSICSPAQPKRWRA